MTSTTRGSDPTRPPATGTRCRRLRYRRELPQTQAIPLPFDWTNFGTAPTYSRGRLCTEQDYDELAAPPASRTDSDLVMIDGGLAAGEYSVRVHVLWDEKKTDATHSVSFEPMQLAQYTRDTDGGYLLGNFSVE